MPWESYLLADGEEKSYTKICIHNFYKMLNFYRFLNCTVLSNDGKELDFVVSVTLPLHSI